jgi:hypothetical protein
MRMGRGISVTDSDPILLIDGTESRILRDEDFWETVREQHRKMKRTMRYSDYDKPALGLMAAVGLFLVAILLVGGVIGLLVLRWAFQ